MNYKIKNDNHINFVSYKNFSTLNVLAYYKLNSLSNISLDNIKKLLLKNNINFKYINNFKITSKFSNNNYFKFLKGSFFLINLYDLNNINLEGLSLFAFYINGYFLNNLYFKNINKLNCFYNTNYLFIIYYLIYFVTIYLQLVVVLKKQFVLMVLSIIKKKKYI